MSSALNSIVPAYRSLLEKLSPRSARALIRRARRDSLLKNSLFIMATTLTTSGFGFVFWVVAARQFSAPAVGLTAAIISASTIIVLASSLGVGGTLIQSLPQTKNHGEWSRISWAGLVFTAVIATALAGSALVLLPLVSSQFAALRGTSYAVLFVVATATMALGATLDYVYLAERRAEDMFSRNCVAAAAKVVLVLILAIGAAGALCLLEAWAAASVIGLILGAILLVWRSPIGRPPRPWVLRQTILALRGRFAGHQIIGMGAALLPYVLPLIVTVRLSTRDNAFFYTTWMFAGIFFIVSPALSQSLFAEGAHRPGELASLARSAMRIIGAILIPALLVVFVAGGTILSVFGSSYANHSETLLRLALLASIPDAVTNVYVAILRVEARLRAAAWLNLAMGVGTLALSWFLIPVMGIGAVGCAFLVMQLSGCAFVALDARKTRSLRARLEAP